MRSPLLACGAVAAIAGAMTAGLATADSFTPVSLAVHVAGTARLHHRLAVRVTVTADAGVLDDRTSSLRIESKLAPECGGVFAQTNGPVLVNRVLRPQPHTGRAYRASVRGAGRPTRAGLQTVCVWLVESGDQRMFAFDDSETVKVRRR